MIDPHATIGEHRHDDDEEVYYVLSGQGHMILDGQRVAIGAGDVAVTPPGHSHGLVNGPTTMRAVVVGSRR